MTPLSNKTFGPLTPYPAVLTPQQAAALLKVSTNTLQHLQLVPVQVRSRGVGLRQHVRYRLRDVMAYCARTEN